MKRYSASLVAREMHIKSARGGPLTPVRRASTKETRGTAGWGGRGEEGPGPAGGSVSCKVRVGGAPAGTGGGAWRLVGLLPPTGGSRQGVAHRFSPQQKAF